MSIDFNTPPSTQITVRPEPQAQRAVPSFQKATLGDNQEGTGFWGKDGFGFDDFIDLINPLQHIPVVSTIYRAITGDEIAPGLQLVGGLVVGGAIGFAATSATLIAQQEMGVSVSDELASLFTGDEAQVALAAKPKAELIAAATQPPAALVDPSVASVMGARSRLAPPDLHRIQSMASASLTMPETSSEKAEDKEAKDRAKNASREAQALSDTLTQEGTTNILELFEPELARRAQAGYGKAQTLSGNNANLGQHSDFGA